MKWWLCIDNHFITDEVGIVNIYLHKDILVKRAIFLFDYKTTLPGISYYLTLFAFGHSIDILFKITIFIITRETKFHPSLQS